MSLIGAVVFILGAIAGTMVTWFVYQVKRMIQNFKENV